MTPQYMPLGTIVPIYLKKVNEDLSHLTDLFRANQISVSASKTKYMLTSSKNNTIKSTATIKIDDENLDSREKSTESEIRSSSSRFEHRSESLV